MIEPRFHWFPGTPAKTDAVTSAFGVAVIRALAERGQVVVWHDSTRPCWLELPGTIEWAAFAPTNAVHRRLNDGVPVYDLLEAGARAAWAAGALTTCPGVVLVRRTRWNQLAANLPGAPAEHLRFAREEQGELGLAAATAYWRGALPAAELERRAPLPRWVVSRALAVVVEAAERDVVVDPRQGVPVFELPTDPAALADRLAEIVTRSQELRTRCAARLLADNVGAAARTWVRSGAADLTFARAAAAIGGLLDET